MSNNGHHKPRIFIGAPVYGKVDHEILEDWMRFMYHLGRRMQDYDFFLGIKPKTEQFRARIAIVEEAQKAGCEWLLMLDDDMVINHFITQGQVGTGDDAYGFLEKMIGHNKDICGALYWQRGGTHEPVLMTKVSEAGYRFLREDELIGAPQKVDVAGGGCLLIRMSVFDKIQPPYFAPEHKWSTDIQLCKQAAEKGFEVWVDSSIEIGHLKDEKVIVSSRNRRQLSMTLGGDSDKSFLASDIYSRLLSDAAEYTGRAGPDALSRDANSFMELRNISTLDDAEWYRQHPMERVNRQVWFNTEDAGKKYMTQYIISSVNHQKKLRILDFGCGIGIPAFSLAEQGHTVTAMDIRGTGTFEFLKWRAAKHGVVMSFIESEGGAPQLNEQFDVIIAMDSIEHIEQWRETVKILGEHLKPGGVLFSNNGILEDKLHPEHYDIDNREFIDCCMVSGMMPFNQITYVKNKEAVYA